VSAPRLNLFRFEIVYYEATDYGFAYPAVEIENGRKVKIMLYTSRTGEEEYDRVISNYVKLKNTEAVCKFCYASGRAANSLYLIRERGSDTLETALRRIDDTDHPTRHAIAGHVRDLFLPTI